MDLIFFSKSFKDKDANGLIRAAGDFGIEGYDLCVRDGYYVTPENIRSQLPGLMKAFAQEKLSVPMVTGPTDLVRPDHSAARAILAGMSDQGVRLLKLGYVILSKGDDYWRKVDEFRKGLAGWEALGRKYQVKICYHTHSGPHLGVNCAAMMHLLKDFDPQYLGAYIDPGHLRLEGEEFSFGVNMVREYLSIVALKDVAVTSSRTDEGKVTVAWVPAGQGMVSWSHVFKVLADTGFKGPLSVHAEYPTNGPADFEAKLKSEIAYFRKKRDQAVSNTP
jgi:sugar phosphate isomerase/epimerase